MYGNKLLGEFSKEKSFECFDVFNHCHFDLSLSSFDCLSIREEDWSAKMIMNSATNLSVFGASE